MSIGFHDKSECDVAAHTQHVLLIKEERIQHQFRIQLENLIKIFQFPPQAMCNNK